MLSRAPASPAQGLHYHGPRWGVAVTSSRSPLTVTAEEALAEGHSTRHMQLRPGFLKLRSTKSNGDVNSKGGKNDEANVAATTKKGRGLDPRNPGKRRARPTSATTASLALAYATDLSAPVSSDPVSGRTTAMTLTPQSSQGVPSPGDDPGGSLLPSLPNLPLAGRSSTTVSVSDRGKAALRGSRRRGGKSAGEGSKAASLGASADVPVYSGGVGMGRRVDGCGCSGVGLNGDADGGKSIDKDGLSALEMSELLAGERQQRYGVGGNPSEVDLFEAASPHPSEYSEWSVRTGSFSTDMCQAPPPLVEPSNPYGELEHKRAHGAAESHEPATDAKALPATGVKVQNTYLRPNSDIAEACGSQAAAGSSVTTKQAGRRAAGKSGALLEGEKGKEVGDEDGSRDWWSRLRGLSDGSMVSIGKSGHESGGFFDKALSGLFAAFEAPPPPATKATLGGSALLPGDGDGGGREDGGAGIRSAKSKSKTSDVRCDKWLGDGARAPKGVNLATTRAAAGDGASVTVGGRQAGAKEGLEARAVERKQARMGEANISRKIGEPSPHSRKLLLESPFFLKARGLEDLKTVLGTKELREGFKQFLTKRWCSENIDFIEEVIRYQGSVRRAGGDDAEVLELGRAIEETFLLKASPNEVNIGQDMRRACLARRARDVRLGVAAVDTFDVVAFELLSLMAHTSLRDFMASAHYATIEACLDLGPRESRNSFATSSATFFDEDDPDSEASIEGPRYEWSRSECESEAQAQATDWYHGIAADTTATGDQRSRGLS